MPRGGGAGRAVGQHGFRYFIPQAGAGSQTPESASEAPQRPTAERRILFASHGVSAAAGPCGLEDRLGKSVRLCVTVAPARGTRAPDLDRLAQRLSLEARLPFHGDRLPRLPARAPP